MLVNERIKEIRKSLNLTQAEFGRKIGIIQGHLTGIESGKKNATKKTRIVICAVYGVSKNWLETGSGEMFVQNPNRKTKKIVNIFSELNFDFQDSMLMLLENLLKLQNRKR